MVGVDAVFVLNCNGLIFSQKSNLSLSKLFFLLCMHTSCAYIYMHRKGKIRKNGEDTSDGGFFHCKSFHEKTSGMCKLKYASFKWDLMRGKGRKVKLSCCVALFCCLFFLRIQFLPSEV